MHVLISIGLCYEGTKHNPMWRSIGKHIYVRVLGEGSW